MPADRFPLHSVVVWGLLVAVVALGGVLRGYRLGGKSLSMGEVAALDVVGKTAGQAAATPRAEPPLYPVALSLWSGGSSDATRARALSAAAGVASLLVFLALARVVLPGWAAAAAALLLAVSVGQVSLAQEARAPALGTLFVTVAWWCLAQLIAGRRLARWPLWLGLAVANTLAVCTCTLGVLSVAAQFLALVLVWGEVGRRLAASWVGWQLVPAAAFVLQAPALGVDGALGPSAASGGFWLWPVLSGLGGTLDGLWTRGGTAVAVAGAALALLIATAGMLALRRHRAAAAIGLAWLAVPLAGAFVLPTRMRLLLRDPTEVAFVAPALCLLAGAALAAAQGRARALAAVVVAGAIALNAASSAAYLRPAAEREGWRDATAWFTEMDAPGDRLVIGGPGPQAAFSHYYGGPALVIHDADGGWPDPTLRRTWLLAWVPARQQPPAAAPGALSGCPLVERRDFAGLRGQIVLELYGTRRPPVAQAPPPAPSTPAPATSSPTSPTTAAP